jgi:hypothetical protein
MVSTLTKMVLVIGCILILFHAGGLIADNPADVFLQLFLHPENLTLNSFWNAIKDNGLSLIISGSLATLTIGAFFTGQSTLVIRAVTALFVFNMALELRAIFLALSGSVGNTFSLIIVGLMGIITALAALEWVTGGN